MVSPLEAESGRRVLCSKPRDVPLQGMCVWPMHHTSGRRKNARRGRATGASAQSVSPQPPVGPVEKSNCSGGFLGLEPKLQVRPT